MSLPEVTPESMGREVLGPIVAEFCLRLWSLGTQLEHPEDATFLFCARGGLRLQLAYERFLASSGLESPTRVAPFMVSRLAAMRAALARPPAGDELALAPSAAATLGYEFSRSSLSEVAMALAGAPPLGVSDRWDAPMTPDGFAVLLAHPDGAPVAEAIREQSTLFLRHLHEAVGDRHRAVVVDTGLYGTTRRLLADAVPELDVSSALIALSYPPDRGPRPAKVVGLSVESDGYSPLAPRTALLRYWHFVEWLFEPELPSVRHFRDEEGSVRSNLEIPGWQDRVLPSPGTAFAGVIGYLDALPPGSGARVVTDAAVAWRRLHRAVVWPRRAQGEALTVGRRTHDFGRDESWAARSWHGPVAALRGATMWREGEIARAETPLRLPLLAAIEAAYGVRYVRWLLRGRRLRPGSA